MSARIVMQWHLRQVMASRGLFQTSDLVPLLADRDIHITRQAVHRLVTKAPQRINIDLLAALCDILDCQPNDLLEPTLQALEAADTGTEDTGPGIGDLRPIRAKVRRPHDGG
jgi:DNA-binding Xre family transcriptional regulator